MTPSCWPWDKLIWVLIFFVVSTMGQSCIERQFTNKKYFIIFPKALKDVASLLFNKLLNVWKTLIFSRIGESRITWSSWVKSVKLTPWNQSFLPWAKRSRPGCRKIEGKIRWQGLWKWIKLLCRGGHPAILEKLWPYSRRLWPSGIKEVWGDLTRARQRWGWWVISGSATKNPLERSGDGFD